MLKKLLSLIICVLMLIFSAACRPVDTPAEQEDEANFNQAAPEIERDEAEEFTLHFSYHDDFNPFRARSSGNMALASLIFDPLVRLDQNLNPENVIANRVTISGRSVTVHLRGQVFSNGQTITADDVVFSLEQARESRRGAFVGQLSNVTRVNAINPTSLVITLRRPDRNFERNLDIPIMQQGSLNRTNADGKRLPPIGSGRFVFVDEGGEFSLRPNRRHFRRTARETIRLINAPDTSALSHLISSGGVSIYYDGYCVEDMPELGGVRRSVPNTNLVFLGINSTRPHLNSRYIRSAISYGVDRTDILNSNYLSLGSAATSIFPPLNTMREDVEDTFPPAADVERAAEFVNRNGYEDRNREGFFVDSGGEVISLTLTYNEDNTTQSLVAANIARQLQAAGIQIQLNALNTEDYGQTIRRGDYDLYLAEFRLCKSFDYTPLFGRRLNITGYDDEDFDGVDVLREYRRYMNGSLATTQFLHLFASEMPFIPLIFRANRVSFSNKLNPELISSFSDPFFNIEYLRFLTDDG